VPLDQRGHVAVARRTSVMWQQLEYRVDVCRVTSDTHIESLVVKKIFFSVFLRLGTTPLR
jgi:hypothetical protein